MTACIFLSPCSQYILPTKRVMYSKLKPTNVFPLASRTLLAIHLNQTFAVQALLCRLRLLWTGN